MVAPKPWDCFPLDEPTFSLLTASYVFSGSACVCFLKLNAKVLAVAHQVLELPVCPFGWRALGSVIGPPEQPLPWHTAWLLAETCSSAFVSLFGPRPELREAVCLLSQQARFLPLCAGRGLGGPYQLCC